MPDKPPKACVFPPSLSRMFHRISEHIASARTEYTGADLAKLLCEQTDAGTVLMVVHPERADQGPILYVYPPDKEPLYSVGEWRLFFEKGVLENRFYPLAELSDNLRISEVLHGLGLNNGLLVPLQAGGDVIGIVVLADGPDSMASDETEQILHMLQPILTMTAQHARIRIHIEDDYQKRLQESEERFLKTFHANPAPLAISDLETGRFIDVNEECLRMHKYVREEMVGHTSWEINVWVDMSTRDRAISKLRAAGSFRNEPVQFRINYGEIRDVLWSAEIISLNGKEVMLSLLIDVTDRQRTEQALRESEERFFKAFSANPAPLAISDLETGLYIDVNEECLRLFHYKREEMVGHTSLELNIWVDWAFRERMVNKLRTLGSFRHEPTQFRTGQGLIRDFLWSAEIITLNGKPVMLTLLIDVTERKQNEKALRESEERFSKAFSCSPAPLLISEIDTGRFIDVNGKWLEMLGYTRDEMIGKTSLELGIWVDAEARTGAIAELQATGRFTARPVRFFSKRKEIRNVLWSAEVVTLNEKRVMLSSMLDYTDRKRAEEALLESEERFSKAFSANPASIVITEIDTGKFIDVNEKWIRMLGYTREEMVGHTSTELGIWADPGIREKMVDKLKKNGRFEEERVRFLTKGGEIRHLLWSAEIITLNKQDVMLSLLLDYTDRKRAEEALRESEERFSKAFHSNPAPLIISEIDSGRFIDFNEKWSQMLGYSREEMMGRTSKEVGIWAENNMRDTAMAKLRAEGVFKDEHVRFLTKTGEVRNALWSAEEIVLNGENVMLSLILDYTDRKRAEDALEKRIIALTQPFEVTGEIDFEDLFNLEEIQQLQDAFAKATGVASLITKADGTPLTRPSNFTRLCSEIIRKTDRGRANCKHSDACTECLDQEGPIVHACLSGGLWDAKASIIVGDHHVACWHVGQVRNEAQTEENMRAYAREIGVEEQEFLRAFYEVPIMSNEQFERIAQSLYVLAKQVSKTAYQNVQQARFISDRKRAEDALRIIAESNVAPGEDIFRSLVKQLAVSQGKQYAFLARIDESDLTMIHTVAIWCRGHFLDNFSYRIDGSPCLGVLTENTYFVAHGIQHQFPQNQLLKKMNLDSYWGVSLHSGNGTIMGVLAIMDEQAMEENPQTFSLLNSFAIRAASEMERRKIEEKYRILFNEMLDGFAVHEIIFDETDTPVDYRFLTVNPAFERIIGITADKVIGKKASEIMPNIRGEWFEHFSRVALTGQPAHFEAYSTLFGRYFEMTVFCPEPKQFACIFTDITDRKKAEAERQALEERYHTLVDNLPIGVFRNTPDPNGRFLMVNAALVNMCGYCSAEALQSIRVADLYVEPAMRKTITDELLAKGIITAREVMLQRADKSRFWAAISCQVFYNPAGEVECFDGSVLDITERKNAEEALRENERRLSYALSATSDAIWEWDCMTQAVYYSPRWYEMLGYDFLEYAMSFATWETLCHPDDYAQTIERVHSVLEYQREQGYETEFRMRHKNGAWVWILGRGNVVERSPGGAPLLLSGTNTDITERKRAEAERERLEDQLRQAQKMEAVGQLAGGVAHDFNNLLQVILGHLDLLQGEGDQVIDEVHEVRQAAERAADLTRQLLAFSRRQIIQPVNLDLNELVEGVLKMIRRVIGENIELRFLPGNRLGTVHADKGQIEQVLMNLCVNARDAMPNGGTLTIETENVIIGDAYCRDHLWALEGRYVLLSVTDTGNGMDEITRSQIFEPFFTTKGVGEGTGLGLATVHGIIKQHNGLIYVYSELGKGTAFKVYIPIVERPAEVVGSKVEAPVVGGTETILVAEDEEAVRNLVCRILQGAGYTVLKACDGEDALRLFEQHADSIDLALLDVMMPKLGGRDVMEYIGAKNAGIRFLFSSGYSENAIHTNFVMKEGIHLITKPYRKPDLLRAVRKTLDERL